ncbi:YaiO family outer membrane beta-barrel protein [Phaeocystidibacter marisrubri]|uniref:YaiO family outer membrane beta-barrel protein n=1 Tax=Phaeocystidibacter marisrubri TaxID=1577780 RepID=A0A6L3ZKN5_9FLAO|nr:YaiO family outer membrane beta-barrel protein [Phaeocystidibacter marisrubri]KAB2818025.1 YaiO family outer membrane beta-barrel protein [Phaeocystidibacter marisrubri]GGH72331.1 hypothetical protein GCM10011318_16190 [Phaeocystidibacter marisrubri]
MNRLFITVLFLVISPLAWAQVNADSLFLVAKHHVEIGEFGEAREILKPALEAYPDYHDIRVYIGRTHAWEGDYSTARAYYEATLQRDSTFGAAWVALGDIDLWQKNYETALSDMETGLTSVSDSTSRNEMKIRKANALFQLREYRHTLDALDGAYGPRADRLRQSTLLRLVNNSVDLTGTAEFFSDVYDNMYYTTLQAGQSTKYGVGIIRINSATRFGETGIQGEIDLYPRITDNVYGYLNYGYSSNENVFPEHRFGAEIYSAVGNRFEASLGIRNLYFGPDASVTMYTASLSYYYSKYFFSIRPFLTPQDNGTDVSVAFLARRYLKNDSRSWLTVKANIGFSPDARRIQVGAGESVSILQTTQIGAEWQQALSTNWVVILGFNFTQQELPFDPGSFVSIYAPTLGIKRLL